MSSADSSNTEGYGYTIPLIVFSLTLLFTTVKYSFFDNQNYLNFLLVMCPLLILNTSVFALLDAVADLSSIGGFLLGNLTLVLAVVLFETLNLYLLQFVAFLFNTTTKTKSRMALIAVPLWALAFVFIILSFIPGNNVKEARIIIEQLLFAFSGLLDIVLSILAISVLKRVKLQLVQLNQKLNIDPESFVKRLTIIVYAKLGLMVLVLLTAIFDPAARKGYTVSVFGLWVYLLFLHVGVIFLKSLRTLAMASPDYGSVQVTQVVNSKAVRAVPSIEFTSSAGDVPATRISRENSAFSDSPMLQTKSNSVVFSHGSMSSKESGTNNSQPIEVPAIMSTLKDVEKQ